MANYVCMYIVLLATLDVHNALNTLRWVAVVDALRTKFAYSGYQMRFSQCFLWNRELIYNRSQRRRRKYITAGAVQGLILVPDLWNTIYDDIFRIEMPDDAHLVGYAEDGHNSGSEY